jgi:GNAT superfamily N-acetyltransferase
MDVSFGDYTIGCDRARLDVATIHRFLTDSYWARGVTRETVERSIANSVPFGAWHEPSGAQVGFARVITDRATFGYLADVFVLEPHRGKGLARRLVAAALAHPELAGFRRWLLVTRDAHPVYRSVGFTALEAPERFMQLIPPQPAP